MGWRGGCLVAGSVRSAVCHYCLGGCSVLFVSARRPRQVGRAGLVPLLVAPPPPLSLPHVPRGACSRLPGRAVLCPCLRVRHSMWSVRSASWVRLPFWRAPRVHCGPVCSRTPTGHVFALPLPFGARPSWGPLAGCWWGRSTRFVPLRISCSGFLFCLWLVGGGVPALSSPVLFPCGVGHSPSPDRPSLGLATGARCPCFLGRGKCGRGGLSPYPQRTLSRVDVVRLGGSTRKPGEGAPLARVWGVRGWSLSLPQPPAHGAGGRGPLPSFRGRRGCGRGGPAPTPQRALLRAGFARCGGSIRALGPW